jgi:hypothetical protein
MDRDYLGGDGPPAYELDSQRNAEEVLAQHKGGGCGSSAMAIAEILKASGVADDSIRLVGAVTNQAYSEICRQAGRPRSADPRTSGDGHVFVMVKQPDGQWRIANTTTQSAAYESAPIASPEKLSEAMAKYPVRVPTESYYSMLSIPELRDSFGTGMTVFQIWKPSEYPKHDWTDRLDLIASGKMKRASRNGAERICRYDAREVLAGRPSFELPNRRRRASPAGAAHSR